MDEQNPFRSPTTTPARQIPIQVQDNSEPATPWITAAVVLFLVQLATMFLCPALLDLNPFLTGIVAIVLSTAFAKLVLGITGRRRSI